MKTEWDYTILADAYLERPEYSPEAIQKLLTIAQVKSGDKICDIGAGVAHLTIPLAQAGFIVDAVEPNDAMRKNGIERTKAMTNVSWSEGTGENTNRPADTYDFVTFGSSFNVCDRPAALKETYRLLKSHKYFTCMWNHRDLNDPIQAKIESIIKSYVPEYGYGTRREDQTDIINESGLFIDVQNIEGTITHMQEIEKTVEAWRSHGTLHRQTKDKFTKVITDIDDYLKSLNQPSIQIPYTTRAWIAKRKD